jgi:hypothetical protein
MSFHLHDDDARLRRAQGIAQQLRAALVRLGVPETELIHVHGRIFVDARPDDVYVGPITLESAEKLLRHLGAPADGLIVAGPDAAPGTPGGHP